jgi:hypothetical protein
MAQFKNFVWTGFIARLLAMLPHGVTDPGSSSGSNLNTQDEREYRQCRQSTVRANEELAGAQIRESLDNLRW